MSLAAPAKTKANVWARRGRSGRALESLPDELIQSVDRDPPAASDRERFDRTVAKELIELGSTDREIRRCLRNRKAAKRSMQDVNTWIR